MNNLLNFLFSVLLLSTVAAVPVSKSPFSSGNEQLIGHFPSSSKPEELFHISDAPQELVHKLPTFAPGAFTHKWTLPPLGKKTFAPLDLAVTKKPHTHKTKGPNKEELSHHVTFPHGAFTQKITVSPIGKRTFAPVELVGVDEKSLISWAPADFAKVSKKPHITPPTH
ncbi:hypothetical protein GCK72_013783 [Caenorhabditis remanei]|uniref:Uncharacterized protein n=1 Tax=Caenorhabditis remanei TaxID=31234 RepID=A0A6A5GPE9_CAERE|nr:hypothetical protein GCK72_013783 [Caenorhabditis remanei]KAF1757328.1 hypothetical protein GCK72_013783 [Caenorhabditis remanei]